MQSRHKLIKGKAIRMELPGYSCTCPPKMVNVSLLLAAENAVISPCVNAGSSGGCPNAVLQYGPHTVELLPVEGAGEGKGEGVVNALLKTLVALAVSGQILPDGLDSRIPKDSHCVLVPKNVQYAMPRDRP